MTKKRILFILSSLKFGGAEKQTLELINNLDECKFKIGLSYLEKKEDLINHIRMTSVSTFQCCEKTNKLDVKVLNRLNGQIRRFRPDIVICVDPYPGLYAHFLRKWKNIKFKIIQIIHQTIMPSLYHEFIVKYLYRHLLNMSETIIFVCKNQMNYWENRYGIRPELTHFIYNGIDTDYFNAKRLPSNRIDQLSDKLDITKTDIVIGICAVLRPEKKHGDLLDALRRLTDADKSIKLLIIGDGPQRSKINAKIRKLGLEPYVRITGFQKDVRPYISLCDLMAITSVSVETFSLAALESMSMEKPVIASDIGGASEQIREGETGFLYPAGNVDVLVDKIRYALDKKMLHKMGALARKRVEDKFSIPKMVNAYNRLLYADGRW